VAGLTALKIKHAKPGRHGDGAGLYLLVSPGLAKSWMIRVQVEGRRRDIGLPSLHTRRFVEPSNPHSNARRRSKLQIVVAGIDPID
jgi:hypothetical protein